MQTVGPDAESAFFSGFIFFHHATGGPLPTEAEHDHLWPCRRKQSSGTLHVGVCEPPGWAGRFIYIGDLRFPK